MFVHVGIRNELREASRERMGHKTMRNRCLTRNGLEDVVEASRVRVRHEAMTNRCMTDVVKMYDKGRCAANECARGWVNEQPDPSVHQRDRTDFEKKNARRKKRN